jgi:hypothetical protein
MALEPIRPDDRASNCAIPVMSRQEDKEVKTSNKVME